MNYIENGKRDRERDATELKQMQNDMHNEKQRIYSTNNYNQLFQGSLNFIQSLWSTQFHFSIIQISIFKRFTHYKVYATEDSLHTQMKSDFGRIFSICFFFDFFFEFLSLSLNFIECSVKSNGAAIQFQYVLHGFLQNYV